MPELPEVETVKNSIWAVAKNQKICDVQVNHSDIIRNATPKAFVAYLKGETIEAMERRGKYLVFRLSHQKSMVCHLRMTGQLVAFTEALPKVNHCHLVLTLEDCGIYYRDVRRFGGFWIGEKKESFGCGIEKLGVEPLSEDFNGKLLLAKARGKNAPVKGLLLDQTIVAGIGNIYADEICFAAKIHPLRKGNTLSLKECEALAQATKKVLAAAIANRGTTFSDYRDGLGKKGGFQDCLKVYQRSGMPCLCCGTILQKTKCAGRSTTYCPSCQPLVQNTWVIGLTGGIASGKSLASDYLASLGAEIIDADVVAREIMTPKGAVIKKISLVFGEEYIKEDGSLNRSKMREDIFADGEKVKDLNKITHPAIRRRIKSQLEKSNAPIVILVAPLLIEGKFFDLCDEVWLLKTEEKQQLKRLLKRDGISKETAKNMMASQYPFAKKAKYADCIIDNTTGKRHLKKELSEGLEQRKAILHEEKTK